MLKTLKLNSGINTIIKMTEISKQIYHRLVGIKKLIIYVEHCGLNRNGGYYLKSKDDK